MMWWLLFSLSAYAQEDLDLDAVRKIEKELPTTSPLETEDDMRYRIEKRKYRRPYRAVGLPEIEASGIEYGHVKKARTLVSVKDNKSFTITESFYGKFYRLPDEQGFKYIINKDGTCTFKVSVNHFESIEREIALYETPLRYTPAPKDIPRVVYDKELRVLPEVAFYAGVSEGSYMKDLFNDDHASNGWTTQYALLMATKWKYPIKVGGVVNYERSQYKLSTGGKISYSSVSFGPQFKSKDFYLGEFPIRFQTQFRIGPFARLEAETPVKSTSLKFNSSDLLISLEHPIENAWGAFVIGVFFQSQWLNLRDQTEAVSIEASNAINKSYGLSFSQVFE